MPSPNLMASILTQTTSDAALIVLGNSLALYQPPLRVAEEMAMLDIMSGGRLVAGFPVGTSMDTAYSYGQVPLQLRERHAEAHDLIMKSWSERKPFAFNGKYTKLRYVNVWPRPLQQPHPPVWIPGSGSLETWDWVLNHNYVYCYLSYFGYQRAEKVVQGYWNTVAERGIDDNPHRFGFLQLVCVSETDEQAEKDYAEHVKYFYQKMLQDTPSLCRGARVPVVKLAAEVGKSADGKGNGESSAGDGLEGLRGEGAHHRREPEHGA